MEPYATADQVWQGALIFGRIGAVLLMLPGVGESYVPPRIRLSLALVISLALWPVIAGALPALPATIGGMAGWIIREVIVGLMIGALLRSFMTALATAGEIVSLQTTLSFAQTANPLQAQPGTTIAAFLMLLGTTLIFATNTHHLFIAGLVGSYELIAPARPLMTGDFTTMAIDYLYIQLNGELVLINMGYQLVAYLIAGAVLGFMKPKTAAAAPATA